MKKLKSFLISFLLGIVFLYGVSKYIVSWQELKTGFLGFSMFKAIIFFCLMFLGIIIDTFRWKEILKSKNQDFSLKQLLFPNLACFAISYLIPIAVFWADFFRSNALNVKNDLAREKGLASAFIDRILSSFTSLITILFGSLVFLLKAGFLPNDLNYFFLGFITFCAFVFIFFLVFFFYSNILEKTGIFNFFLNGINHGLSEKLKKEILSFFRKENIHFLRKSLILSFFKVFTGLAQFWVLTFFLGYSLSMVNLFAIFGISSAALQTPISADLGSHDLVTALAFERLGMARNIGAAFAMIFRGTNLILALIGIVFFIEINFQIFKHHIFQKIEKILCLLKTKE